MENCPNCNQKIEGFHLDCPNCGFQLVTPEQAQALLESLDRIEDHVLNLDMSPEGINKTAIYLDNVAEALNSYQSLLVLFFEQHKEAMKKPKLFRDRQWTTNTKMQLGRMYLLWSGMENRNFSLKVIGDYPPGCFFITKWLMEIRDLTKILISDYEHYLDQKDPNGLEKSKKSLGEISERLDKTWSEVQKVHKQITTFLNSSDN